MRTAYRYLQHFVTHPYLWRYLKGGRLRSWGAKRLQESGRRGEPILAATDSRASAKAPAAPTSSPARASTKRGPPARNSPKRVIELVKPDKPFTRENLAPYDLAARRASWVEQEGRVAEKARDGFHRGVVTGLIGMALAGMTGGKRWLGGEPELLPDRRRVLPRPHPRCRAPGHPSTSVAARGIAAPRRLDGPLRLARDRLRRRVAGVAPGRAPARRQSPGAAGIRRPRALRLPRFLRALRREDVHRNVFRPGAHSRPAGVPQFDRDKCVHCGACVWNCTVTLEDDPTRGNIEFKAGAGGLHSGEN